MMDKQEWKFFRAVRPYKRILVYILQTALTIQTVNQAMIEKGFSVQTLFLFSQKTITLF